MAHIDSRNDNDRLGWRRTVAGAVGVGAAVAGLALGIKEIPQSTTPEQTGQTETTTSAKTFADMATAPHQESTTSETSTTSTTTTELQLRSPDGPLTTDQNGEGLIPPEIITRPPEPTSTK